MIDKEFYNFDSAWSPPYQPWGQFQPIHYGLHVVNNEDASHIAKYGNIDNHVVEDHQMANYQSMVNQLLQTPNIVPLMGAKNFPDQTSHPTFPSKFMLSMPRVDLMTVEQTAEWIWTVGHVCGWDEADQYAESFQKNNIWGWLLQKLTVDCLKSDLGINKFGHRLMIMSAIRHLYFGSSGWECNFGADTEHSGKLRKGASEVNENSTNSPHMLETKRSKYSWSQGILSPNSSPIYTPRVGNNGKAQLLQKSITNKEQSSSTRVKSTRASPDNPTRYKTFYKVKIRSGKSVRSADLGYLPKGSVVIINQVKGRSGRVVFPQDDGEFVKVGWVTLYTDDRQLLRKCVNKKNQT